MYENQKITYEPFLALDSAEPRSVTIRESFIIQRYEDNKVYLYELTQPLELWETEPDNLTIDDIKVKIKELIETEFQEGDPSISDYNAAKAAKELAKAKAERFKALNTAMSANFIDTGETGFEFPISRNDRQSLNEYGTLLQNAKDAGLITDTTQNAIFPVGTDGTDTVTLPDFKGLLLRYGMAILTRQQTQAVKKSQIEAATTIAEVDAITW